MQPDSEPPLPQATSIRVKVSHSNRNLFLVTRLSKGPYEIENVFWNPFPKIIFKKQKRSFYTIQFLYLENETLSRTIK